MLSDEARADRARSVPLYQSDDITGQVALIYKDDKISSEERQRLVDETLAARRAARASRSPDARDGDDRLDEHEDRLDRHAIALAGIQGELKHLPSRVADAVTTAHEASRLASASRTTTMTIETAEATGATQVRTAVQLDKVDAGKDKRKLIVQAILAAIALMTSGAVVQHCLGAPAPQASVTPSSK